MNNSFFQTQMERIKKFFGAEHYPLEKKQLIWQEVKDLEDQAFFRIVNLFIAEKSPKWPMHVSHFREQAEIERKAAFAKKIREVGGSVANDPNRQFSPQGKEKALEQLGFNSLMDAVFKRRSGGAK